MRKVLAASIIAALLVVTGLAYASDAPKIGDTVDDHVLKTIEGKSVKLSDYRNDKDGKGGKFVVLTFWSYKCPTGKRMMEYNEKVAEFCRENDAVFLGISSYGESKDQVKEYSKKKNVSYSIAYDDDQSMVKKLGANVVSTTAILDKDGKVVYYGSLVSRKDDKETGAKVPHVLNAMKQLVAGKKVSKSETTTFG
ncbi:MAG: TlpA disulfide reductase family protein [Planctomycetota bacterium]|nr:TlpA disulfide reductase family protein [Planctomycetota bacterium]